MSELTLLQEVIAYRDNVDLKTRYEKYIADTTIPLDDRWKLFCEAPQQFKGHQSWLVNFASEKLLPAGEISWYDDFYVNQNETVECDSFVNERLYGFLIDQCDIEEQSNEAKLIIDSFKAEILEMNLGSFDYDW